MYSASSSTETGGGWTKGFCSSSSLGNGADGSGRSRGCVWRGFGCGCGFGAGHISTTPSLMTSLVDVSLCSSAQQINKMAKIQIFRNKLLFIFCMVRLTVPTEHQYSRNKYSEVQNSQLVEVILIELEYLFHSFV